jgi:solute carrier family 25 (mitochondrial folate transporter), member 32
MRILGAIVKYEGVGGLYAGWTPAVIGSAISWGGYFFFYEDFKRRLLEYRRHKKQQGGAAGSVTTALSIQKSATSPATTTTPADNFVLACSAGGIMVLLTNPIWLIKTRMQLQLRKASEQYSSISSNSKPYRGMIDAAHTIVRDEGFLALYRGSGPALLLTSHGGVQFVVYEYLRKFEFFQYSRAKRDDNKAKSVWERLELSGGYLTIGAVAKM